VKINPTHCQKGVSSINSLGLVPFSFSFPEVLFFPPFAAKLTPFSSGATRPSKYLHSPFFRFKYFDPPPTLLTGFQVHVRLASFLEIELFALSTPRLLFTKATAPISFHSSSCFSFSPLLMSTTTEALTSFLPNAQVPPCTKYIELFLNRGTVGGSFINSPPKPCVVVDPDAGGPFPFQERFLTT